MGGWIREEAETGGGGYGDDGGVSINMPRRSAHEFYLVRLLGAVDGFRQIIYTMSNATDPRIVPAARQCIIMIPDDNIRKNLYQTFERCLAKIDLIPVTAEKKGELTMAMCQVALGEVVSYADEYLGISKVNVLAPLAAPPPEKKPGELPAPIDDDKEVYADPTAPLKKLVAQGEARELAVNDPRAKKAARVGW